MWTDGSAIHAGQCIHEDAVARVRSQVPAGHAGDASLYSWAISNARALRQRTFLASYCECGHAQAEHNPIGCMHENPSGSDYRFCLCVREY